MVSENAIVESFKFSLHRDWNVPTFSISLETGSGCVNALGGIVIMNDDPYTNYTNNINNYTGYFLSKVFEVFDVDDLNDIVRKPVRAIFKTDGKLGDTCIGIQHFLKDGIFFIPSLVQDDSLDMSTILKGFDLSIYESNVDFYRIAQNVHKKVINKI